MSRNLLIDPGHGGFDPGAVNQELRIYEKDINLKIALAVKDELSKSRHLNVMMVRGSDYYVSLCDIVKIANKENAILLSIHCNSSENPLAQGFETWRYTSSPKSSAFDLACTVHGELGSALCYPTVIMEDRGLKYFYDEKKDENVNRPIKVLKDVTTAILVECGFISNEHDAALLQKDSFLDMLAKALSKGIDSYAASHVQYTPEET